MSEPSRPANFATLDEAAHILKQGGLVLYPTETYYAIGCLISAAAAARKIFDIKKRPLQNPLPVIAANSGQAEKTVELAAAPQQLLATFWPGPLTLVLPAKIILAYGLINPQHKVALRVTGHPEAAALAEAAGQCITATSANISGRVPAASAQMLDPELIETCAASGLPWGIIQGTAQLKAPQAPSTLAEPEWADGQWRLHILREGAITRNQLAKWNVSAIL